MKVIPEACHAPGTAYPSGAPEFTPGFQWGSCYSIFSFFMYVLLIVVCLFVLFHLVIVLSVLLRYTDSDCPFGNFKLFLDIYVLLRVVSFDYHCFAGLLCTIRKSKKNKQHNDQRKRDKLSNNGLQNTTQKIND